MFKVKEKILSADSYKLKNESHLSPPFPVSIPKLKHCSQLLMCPGTVCLGICKCVHEFF